MEEPHGDRLPNRTGIRVPPREMPSSDRSHGHQSLQHLARPRSQLQALRFWVGEDGVFLDGPAAVVVDEKSRLDDDGLARVHRPALPPNRDRLQEKRRLQLRRFGSGACDGHGSLLLGKGPVFDIDGGPQAEGRRR